MSFIDICWLIVKICAIISLLFGLVGIVCKKIAQNRQKKEIEELHKKGIH